MKKSRKKLYDNRPSGETVTVTKERLLELLTEIKNLVIMDCLSNLDLQLDCYSDEITLKAGYKTSTRIWITADIKEDEQALSEES